MKIVRQLANWLLENDRITPDHYREVLLAIQGEIGKGEGELLRRADLRQGKGGSDEDAAASSAGSSSQRYSGQIMFLIRLSAWPTRRLPKFKN